MYWLRSADLPGLLIIAAQTGLWIAGGWLWVRGAFRLRPGERLISGVGAGLLLFITLSNLLANILPVDYAFWIGGVLCFGLGVWANWGQWQWRRMWDDLRLGWGGLAVLLALSLLFSLIQRGLAIFDDYQHLPLVSRMAAGDIPPHFYLDPQIKFAYHYGLHVWSASLIRGGFTPWAAFDIGRAFSIALAAVSLGMLALRWTRKASFAWLAAAGLLFAGGVRWLLLLFPVTWLSEAGTAAPLINSAADGASDLLDALIKPWVIDGGGLMPFPFAFHTGVFTPLSFVYANTAGMPYLTIVLLLMFNRLRRLAPAASGLALIVASLALSAEHLFAFAWAAIALFWVLQSRTAWRAGGFRRRRWLAWGAILAFSAALSVVQGGYITETVRSVLAGLSGVAAAQTNVYAFGLRPVPALVNAHFADLALTNPLTLIIALLELGPVLLLSIPATALGWRAARRGDWLLAGLSLTAIASLLFSIFIRFGLDRASTRFPSTALWLWLILGLPWLWSVWQRNGSWRRGLLTAAGIITLTGGLVIFAIQLTAIPNPQFTYFVSGLDSQVNRLWWDKLPAEAQVLDSNPSRGPTIFGRAQTAFSSVFVAYPDWTVLIDEPWPDAVRAAGYDYVYFDEHWWGDLTPPIRQAYADCAIQLVHVEDDEGGKRDLYSLQNCR